MVRGAPVPLKDDDKIVQSADDRPVAGGHSDHMKRPTKQILVGLLVAGVVFALVCGALKATTSASTFNVVNPIWLAIVVMSWLAWSFRGRLQQERRR